MDPFLLPYETSDGRQAFLNLNLVQSLVFGQDAEGVERVSLWSLRFQADVPSQSWVFSKKTAPMQYAMLVQWAEAGRLR